MTWTAPQTWTTNQVVTAADMNGDVRDNMLETAAATAAAAGDIVYADAANSMGSRVAHPGTGRLLVSDASSGLAWRQPAEDVNFADAATSGGFISTSYTSVSDADPGGSTLPSVTVTTGTLAIVSLACQSVQNNTGGQTVSLSFSVSGSTTVSASDSWASRHESSSAGDHGSVSLSVLQSLTAGSNTFQMEAKASNGTGTVIRPRILVIPL